MTKYIAPWRKALLPASFRGVPFKVKSAQTTVGRRVSLHEYPQRDEGWPEDLGQKDDAFTIEAIVIGPDYFNERDALITALKKRGAGELVHPYYGRKTVTLASPARISESSEEGGMARFSLDFVEAGENEEPSARPDTQAAVDTRADAANAAVCDDFDKIYSLEDQPNFVESNALDVANGIGSKIDGIRRSLVPNLSVLSNITAAASRVMGSINSLIRAPAAFAQAVLGMIGQLRALATSPLTALKSYRGLFDYGGEHPTVRTTTPARARQATNQVAMTTLVRRIALIEGARTASEISYPTYDQAVTVRDDLAARLDDEAAGIVPAPTGNGAPATMTIEVSDPVYQALTALRIALIRDITERAIDAPRVTSATLPATLPALVAAYRIYGDATRESDLLDRNPVIQHPGFVPGGVALEIIVE